jgi:hypothetical protein
MTTFEQHRVAHSHTGYWCHFTCPDCGANPVCGYMVKDELWASTGLPRRAGYYCLSCFERRIGRKITKDDLKPDLPFNDWLFNSLSN